VISKYRDPHNNLSVETAEVPLKTSVIIILCFISVYAGYGVASEKISECGQNPTTEYLTSNLQSPDFSKRWFAYTKCKAEKGDAEAQLSMGIIYRDGADGPPQNYIEAKNWFLKSAENGNGMAMYNLGLMFFEGRGVDTDYVRAYTWFSLAASFLPEDGVGTRNRAFEYRNRAAEKLNPSQLSGAQEYSSKKYHQIDQAL